MSEENGVEEQEEAISFIPVVLPDEFAHISPYTYDFENCVTRVDRNYTKDVFIDDVIAAIVYTQGDFSHMAVLLARSRNVIKNFVYKTPEAFAVLDSVTETFLDKVEHGYRKKATNGDGNASQFFLKSLGSERGYGPKVKVEAEHSGTIGVRDESPRDSIMRKLAGLAGRSTETGSTE